MEMTLPSSTTGDPGKQFDVWVKRSKMLWTTVGPIILTIGIFGNALIIVLLRRMLSRKSNFPLLFMALAVTDLLLLNVVIIPRSFFIKFHDDVVSLSRVPCKLLLWAEFSLQTLSAWLLTAMTVQRAVSIVCLRRKQRMKPKTRALITVTVLTIASFAFNSSILYDMDKEHSLSMCGWMENRSDRTAFDWVELVVNAILPSLLMLVCNCIMIRVVTRSSNKTHYQLQRGHVEQHDTIASRVTLTLIVVSFVFILLTIPMNMINIVKNMNPELRSSGPVAFVHHLTVLLWISNSATNFFLYAMTGTKFRRELKNLMTISSKPSMDGMVVMISRHSRVRF